MTQDVKSARIGRGLNRKRCRVIEKLAARRHDANLMAAALFHGRAILNPPTLAPLAGSEQLTYHGCMEQNLSLAEELAHLRQLVKSLEGGAKVIRAGRDITQDELRILRLQIAFLEKSIKEPSPQTAKA
jgi:hypothetical protein